MTFKEFFILIIEGQLEDQTLAIVNKNQQLFQQIKVVSPEPKYMPIVAYFHAYENMPINQLGRDVQSFKILVDKKQMPMLQITRKGAFLGNQQVNYLTWTEKIHAIEGKIAFNNRDNNATPINGKPIFSKNNIDVYESHGRDKCIQYGKGYSFCISKPNNTMWQSYRDVQASTFYFVFDRNRPQTDPLHVVVVDCTQKGFSLTDATNNTGNIAEFGRNAEAYIQYLKNKGIPRKIFKNIKHSKEEKNDIKKIGKKHNFDNFVALSHAEKSRYIGKGHQLDNDQFNYLIDNKLDDLLHQYCTTGRKLSEFNINLIKSNVNLLKSYLRSRLIAMDNNHNLVPSYELLYYKEYFDKETRSMILKSKKLLNAVKLGYIDLINQMIQDGANDFENAMYHATIKGHIEIVKLMIKHGANDFENAMLYAAENGHIEIVKLMIKHGANEFDDTMYDAAGSGHIKIVKLMIKHGANEFDTAMYHATIKGHIEIVKLMIKHGANDFENAMLYAAENGHIEIVKLMIKHGANEFNIAMHNAAENGHIEIVKLMIKHGANDFNTVLYLAAGSGHIEIVKLMIQYGANDFDDAIWEAGYRKHTNIVKLLRKYI